MSSLFIQLDVEYATDDEFIEAGPMPELLYIRALCFSKRKTTDGFITTSQLQLVGNGIKQVAKHATTLVNVGLWTTVEGGYQINAYLKRNKSKAQLEDEKALAAELGAVGAHERWHTGPEGKPSPKCKFCRAERIAPPMGDSNRGQWPETEAEAEAEAEAETKEEALPHSVSTHSPGAELTPDEKKKCTDVLECIIDRRINGKPVGASYRAKVHDDVKSEYAKKIARLVPMFPEAPIDMIAHGAESGDTRNLAHYGTPTPTPEPDGPKLSRAEREALIEQNTEES